MGSPGIALKATGVVVRVEVSDAVGAIGLRLEVACCKVGLAGVMGVHAIICKIRTMIMRNILFIFSPLFEEMIKDDS